MCIGGRLGAKVDIGQVQGNDLPHSYVPLFSESNGRLLLEVAPGDVNAFEETLAGLPIVHLGTVTRSDQLVCQMNQRRLFSLPMNEIVTAWKGATVE
jgi:phosphoribosylformylglycinamidine synthase